MDKKLAWFQKHGIEGLLSCGVNMYLWDDQKHQFDIMDMCTMINVLFKLTKYCCTSANLTGSDSRIFNMILQPFYDTHDQAGNERELNALIKGITMMKSKIVIQSAEDENTLIQTLFGYTNERMPEFKSPTSNDQTVYKSRNIYNRIVYILEAAEYYAEKTKGVLEEYKMLDGDQKTIYYTQNKLYKQNVEYLQNIIKGYNKLTNALSHDIKVLLSY